MITWLLAFLLSSCGRELVVNGFGIGSTSITNIRGIQTRQHLPEKKWYGKGYQNLFHPKMFSCLEMKGYVPDGLSREEYENIKKRERDESTKKNFGAWGPRFRRTSAPTDDWMVNRSLWTGGFDSNQGKAFFLGAQNPDIITVPNRTFGQLVGKYFPIFIATGIILESIFMLTSTLKTSGSITLTKISRSYVLTWVLKNRKNLPYFVVRALTPLLTINRFEEKISKLRNSGGRLWTRRRCVAYLGVSTLVLDILSILLIKLLFKR